MPWKNVCPMDNKLLFISEYLNGYFSVSTLCERYCTSRKTRPYICGSLAYEREPD